MGHPLPVTPTASPSIPIFAAGTHAGTWHDPLPIPATANDHRLLIQAGDETAVACWMSNDDEGPRLHFDGWSELLHLAQALTLRGRGRVLTFLPMNNGEPQ